MKLHLSIRSITLAALAATLATALAAPATAQHRDRGHYSAPYQRGGGRAYEGYRYHDNSGAIVGGALLGLGLGALLGGALVAPPPVVYAPPPGYYYRYNGPPPYYAYPYAPPPPVYYYGD